MAKLQFLDEEGLKELIKGIKSLIPAVKSLPIPNEDLKDTIYQYLGTSTAYYIQGYFYICDGENWNQLNVQPDVIDSLGYTPADEDDLDALATDLNTLNNKYETYFDKITVAGSSLKIGSSTVATISGTTLSINEKIG